MEDLSMGSRLKHAWNAFLNKDPTPKREYGGFGYSIRPDRPRFTRGNEKSIVTAVYNKIALDVASIDIKHCQLDEDDRYIETVHSSLNNCLSIEANIDQTGRAFIQDVVMSMLDEGCVAIVPIDTNINPKDSGSYDIESMRTGKIIEWKPSDVKVRVYNDRTGEKEEIWLPKKMVAIIENPLYAVINEPNSTMQRLMRKLSLLDVTDEQTASGKLDLIIQLPYVIKTDARRQQAENRRKDIEDQLAGSRYGIAYTDGTERITQLNRSLENNLMGQVEYLTNMLFSQLGMSQAILDGSADEQTMLNYYNRTIEPIVSTIVEEMRRKFLTKTARTQHKTIMAFRDPFKLVPVNNIAEIADKFTRNEIMTSNEIRQVIGLKPSDDPKANQLVNSNISQPNEGMDTGMMDEEMMTQEDYDSAMDELDDLDSQLDDLEYEMSHGDVTEDDEDSLEHYASPYYDPVKAHEYYMKNRELKGRSSSTAGLNEEGKKVANYVKDQLNTERKQKVQEDSDKTNSQINSLRNNKAAAMKMYTEQTQTKINSLREKIKKLKKSGADANSDIVSRQIERIREQNNKKREALNADFKSSSDSLRKDHKTNSANLKVEYDNKIADEINKIRSESRYQKVSKRKSNRR